MNGRHVTAHFAVFYVAWVGGATLNVNLIRSWAHRAKIRRAGKDEDGFALYDLTDIMEYARLRGLLDPESQSCNSDSGQLCL